MIHRAHTFADRKAAGIELGESLRQRPLRPPVLVLGLARGGVPVAHEVATALRAPLDVMVVRKIGMPGQSELAIGAVASPDVVVREPAAEKYLSTPGVTFGRLVERARAELERRERTYRPGKPPLQLAGRTVVLVDDGLATGSTMLAAVRAARQAGASFVVVAAPVASTEAAALVASEADEVVILQTPPFFFAVGEWYESFGQVDDATVRELLASAHEDVAARPTPPSSS